MNGIVIRLALNWPGTTVLSVIATVMANAVVIRAAQEKRFQFDSTRIWF
jgi:hypothetical protein